MKGQQKNVYTMVLQLQHLKITWSGNEYATPSFDHGYPNTNIEAFVNTLTSMAKMPK